MAFLCSLRKKQVYYHSRDYIWHLNFASSTNHWFNQSAHYFTTQYATVYNTISICCYYAHICSIYSLCESLDGFSLLRRSKSLSEFRLSTCGMAQPESSEWLSSGTAEIPHSQSRLEMSLSVSCRGLHQTLSLYIIVLTHLLKLKVS